MIILYIILLLISVIFSFLSIGTIWNGVLTIIICIAGGCLCFIKLPEKYKNYTWIAKLVCAVACIVFCMSSGLREEQGGFFQQSKMLNEMNIAAADADVKEMKLLTEKYVKIYSDSDSVKAINANCYINAEDGENARNIINTMENNKSMDTYYLRAKFERRFSRLQYVKDIYQEAVTEHPDSDYAHLMLGIAEISNKNYVAAQYHVTKAYLLAPDRTINIAYMGVLYAEMCDYENALKYLNEAATCNDIDSDLDSVIGYYTTICNEDK